MAGSSNCAGIQGTVWIDFQDAAGESFGILTDTTNEICGEGFQQLNPPFSLVDVSFGLNLNSMEPFGTALDYDAEANGIVGVEFLLSGPVPMPFFGVVSEGVIYCAPTPEPGLYRFAWEDLRAECWNGTTGAGPNPQRIRSIGFYSHPLESVTFQVCVENIVALRSLP